MIWKISVKKVLQMQEKYFERCDWKSQSRDTFADLDLYDHITAPAKRVSGKLRGKIFIFIYFIHRIFQKIIKYNKFTLSKYVKFSHHCDKHED